MALTLQTTLSYKIGNTPLVKLKKFSHNSEMYAKLERENPGGSIKDRIGLAMIEDAESRKLIRPGYTIIEPTSGNTGMGLALAGIERGYRVIAVMPDKMSRDKIKRLEQTGAQVTITPTAVKPEDPRSYYSVAKRMVEEMADAWMPNQYKNPANPEIHYKTTGPEIWKQMGGDLDTVVIGMGTGGTITGVGRFLKKQKSDIEIVGVDAEGSLYSFYFNDKTPKDGDIHPYRVEGIGEDFIPDTIDFGVIDDVITVSDREAFLTARQLLEEEKIFVGGSAGAAVYAALKKIKQARRGKRVAVVLPDGGENYTSKIFSDEWMTANGFL